MSAFDDSAAWERGRRETERAHRALMTASHRFEVLLRAPATNDWEHRARQRLELLVQRFSTHCDESEAPGGLIREMEMRLGHPQDLTSVETAHRRIAELMAVLVRQLSNDVAARAPYSAFRREAQQLLLALREHETKEVDLLYEIYWRINGAGD